MADTVTIRLNKQERVLFENSAKLYNCSTSAMIKKFAIEKLEDEIDYRAIKKFEEDSKDGKIKLRPIEELWKEMGFND